MQKIYHPAESRGRGEHGWLHSRHTFSFANYFSPDRMGFGALRVINDDQVDPGYGFGTHSHRDMEIVSIPLKGALQHKDSTGREHVIESGEVQIMSAGTGISHSEYNASKTDPVHFLQIWILPRLMNIEPQYAQRKFDSSYFSNRFGVVVSPHGDDEALWINQDAYFSLAHLSAGSSLDYRLKGKDHGVYFFVISGNATVEGQNLGPRDGLGLTGLQEVSVFGKDAAQLLAIDVPMHP